MSGDTIREWIPRDILDCCYVGMIVVKEAHGPGNRGDSGPLVLKGKVVEYDTDDDELDPSIKVLFEDGSIEYMSIDEVVKNCPTLLTICLRNCVPVYVDLKDLFILQDSERLERHLRALDPENPPNENNILDLQEEWSGSIRSLQMACEYLAPKNQDQPIRGDCLHGLIAWFTRLESPRLLAKCDEQKLRVLKAEILSGDDALNELEFLSQHDLPQSFRLCTEMMRKAINRPDITGMMTVEYVCRLVEMMKDYPKFRCALWSSLVPFLPPGIQQRPAPELLLNDATLPFWIHQAMHFHLQKITTVAVIEEGHNDALKRELRTNEFCGQMFPREWEH